jgi:hypothetical protein
VAVSRIGSAESWKSDGPAKAAEGKPVMWRANEVQNSECADWPTTSWVGPRMRRFARVDNLRSGP